MARTFDCARRTLTSAALASLMLCASAQGSQPSLCQTGETVWFSCRVGPAKTVSLCGTRETLQYRFGTPQHLELMYPATASTGYTAFRWAHHARFQADRMQVSFNNRGVDYILFDHTENGQREAGLDVASKQRLRCTGALQSRMAQLKDKLPCDDDSALNLGTCSHSPD
ncbi:hypothetical protein EIP75_15565 [Aquabacterium soli]|uniref:Uncharacterized protein n=1 Tax=Aquabacterium soli TaxID=2493092 RepID=A0A3R8S0R1_9BURK|nr:hypothetical protein [Aquabacterium soli]RRS03368.1 hypothetical protein EIP75_15565 [Aquabacterium soli]